MLAKGKAAICATVSEDRSAHDEMLSQVSSYAETEIESASDDALCEPRRDVPGRQGRGMPSRLWLEHALKLLADGLQRDGGAGRLTFPLVRAKGPGRERGRSRDGEAGGLAPGGGAPGVAAEGERSVSQRAADAKAQTRDAREADLRSRYGRGAAALLKRFSDGFKKRMIEQPGVVSPATTRGLPRRSRRCSPPSKHGRRGLPDQDWQPIAVDLTVADYGMARWNDRALEAIAMEARVQVVSRERGRYDEACFLIATIVDGEFLRYRDPFEAPCDEDVAKLDRWKVGHQLESRWLAPEAFSDTASRQGAAVGSWSLRLHRRSGGRGVQRPCARRRRARRRRSRCCSREED